MKNNISVIKKSILFTGISDTEIESILKCLKATSKKYEKNEYIFHSGEHTDSMGLVLEGSVLVIQEDFFGSRSIRAEIKAGNVFAEVFACTKKAMPVSVTANEASTILWVNIQRILNVCPNTCPHHSRLIRNLITDLAVSQLRTSEKLTHITKRTTREKLLSYLSTEAKKQGKTEFNISFNRQQLADYLSVERSAMSAELSKMQKEGLLSYHKSHFKLNIN